MPGFIMKRSISPPCFDKSEDGFIREKNDPGFMSGFIEQENFCSSQESARSARSASFLALSSLGLKA